MMISRPINSSEGLVRRLAFYQDCGVGLTAPAQAGQACTKGHILSRQHSLHPLKARYLQPVSRAQHVVGLDIIERHQLIKGGVKALRDP